MPILLIFMTFGLSMWMYPRFIAYFSNLQQHQSVSQYALDSFKSKAKTPTLGGLIFVVIPTVMFALFKPTAFAQYEIQMVLLSYLMYAMIGLWDDVKILREKSNEGLSARFKFGLQLVFAVTIVLMYRTKFSSVIFIPGLDLSLDLGVFYYPLILIMLSGASNAVNITDGMDGLAAGTSLIALASFAFLSYVSQHTELSYFSLTVMASLLAFLWFNRKPAKIYMGDVGSLSLGAMLASLALVLKQELLLMVIGLVFVYETVCVMLQITWVKVFKRRLFRYTPIHYSFILKEWKEEQVVALFWGIGTFGAILGLSLWWLS